MRYGNFSRLQASYAYVFFDGLRSFTAEMKSIFEEVSFFVFDFGRFLPCTKTVGFSRGIMI